MSFWKKNLAFAKLAIQTNLEYRFNFLTDAILQPFATALIEVTLWISLFAYSQDGLIGGYNKQSYLAYSLWAAFIARISSNWMYEFRMIEEIDSGSINNILVRPFSFFEFYLSQLLGYKIAITLISFIIPISAILLFALPTDFSKLPIVFCLITYYVVFLHILSFCVSTAAFHLNRIHALTVAKNMTIWLLSGELLPLDLMPDFYKKILLALPFSIGVYIPVGYLTGRVSEDLFYSAFLNLTVSILIASIFAYLLWNWGVRKYVGTGA